MSASTSPKVAKSAVKVRTAIPVAGPGAKTTRYLVGCVPECPIQNPTAGGICFPRFRGNPVFDGPGGAPDRELEYGAYADLTDEQVERIRAGVANRVIRVVGANREDSQFDDAPDMSARKSRGAQMLMLDGSYCKGRLGPHDRPLARYVYMHRADALSREDITGIPETMEE